jgi:hypothetical protein
MTSTALRGACSAYALLAANLAVIPTTIADDDTCGGTTSQSIPVDSSYGLNRAPRDDTAIAAAHTQVAPSVTPVTRLRNELRSW